MRNYLILREKALAFRADPEVQAALEDAAAARARRAHAGRGRDAGSDLEPAAARRRGARRPAAWRFEHLDQLALEHLYGVRC